MDLPWSVRARHPPSPNVVNLEATPTLWCGSSLCRHDWLSHWPLVINSVSSPSPLPENPEGEDECSNPPIIWFLWQSVLIMTLSKGHLISINSDIVVTNNKRCSCHLYHSGNSSGLRSSVSGTWGKRLYGYMCMCVCVCLVGVCMYHSTICVYTHTFVYIYTYI